MMGRDHVLSGALAGVGLAALAEGSAHPIPAVLVIAATAGAAALPDLDEPGSTVARLAGPVTEVVAFVTKRLCGGHRQGSHSLLAVGVLAAVVVPTTAIFPLVAAVTVGVLAALTWRAAAPRGLRHGLVVPLVGTLAGFEADTHPLAALAGLALIVGYLVHLAGDMATAGGVPLLWPDKRHFSAPFLGHTDSGREHLFGFAMALTLGVWCYLLFVAHGPSTLVSDLSALPSSAWAHVTHWMAGF